VHWFHTPHRASLFGLGSTATSAALWRAVGSSGRYNVHTEHDDLHDNRWFSVRALAVQAVISGFYHVLHIFRIHLVALVRILSKIIIMEILDKGERQEEAVLFPRLDNLQIVIVDDHKEVRAQERSNLGYD
jgi:hypothetical protein